MKIAVTSPSFSQNIELVEELKKTFNAELLINIQGKRFNDEEFVEYVKDCDAVIVGLEKLTESVLLKLPNLKFISKYGVGLDNIDVEYCKKNNIKIGWTGGVNKLSVAEMVLGFMLSICRNLYSTNLLIRSGEWKKNGGFQLSEKKVGIIGFGNIGQEVARLLAPFNCEILVNDILDRSEEIKSFSARKASVDEILTDCDFITIHIPGNRKNLNFFDEVLIDKLKKSPILINTSRGGIVNESSVLTALNNGKISFYASDVFEEEPSFNTDLLNHSRVFATPHIGGNSKEAVLLMGKSAIENLRKVINEV